MGDALRERARQWPEWRLCGRDHATAAIVGGKDELTDHRDFSTTPSGTRAMRHIVA